VKRHGARNPFIIRSFESECRSGGKVHALQRHAHEAHGLPVEVGDFEARAAEVRVPADAREQVAERSHGADRGDNL